MNINKELSQELDYWISEHGPYAGPSIVNALRYSLELEPIKNKTGIILSSESKETLDDRMEVIDLTYKNIRPQLKKVASEIYGSDIWFPSNSCDKTCFSVNRNFEEIRFLLQKAYKKNADYFGLDQETHTGLFGDRKLNPSTYIEFAIFRNKPVIYGFRFKQSVNRDLKYLDVWNTELVNEEREKYGEFLLSVIKDPMDFWRPGVREEYLKKFEVKFEVIEKIDNEPTPILKKQSKIERMLLGDHAGLKIIELDQGRANENLKRLSNIGYKLDISPFISIKDRYDNHVKRVNKLIPGGLHYTVVHGGNFAFEVQYVDLQSQILDMFGPEAHNIYTHRGKKTDKVRKKKSR